MTITLETLFDAGCHLGHPVQKWHPKMKPWLYGEQDGIHLFDLEKTAAQLEKVMTYVADFKKNGKTLVVVATKKQASEITEKLATETGSMYIVNRWPGGLITNWDQVQKSIKKMNEIETGLAGDRFKDKTKYERMLLEKELARLERLFGGLKELKNKPDAIFVVDAQKEKNAVSEAKSEGIEIIAVIDSNTDPTGIAWPIPANDDALSSINLLVGAVLSAYAGQMITAKTEEKPKAVATETATVVTPETKTVTKVVAETVVVDQLKKEVESTKKPVKSEKKTTTKKTVKTAVKKAAVAKKPAQKKVATKKEA